jgi:hypothetical protein
MLVDIETLFLDTPTVIHNVKLQDKPKGTSDQGWCED